MRRKRSPGRTPRPHELRAAQDRQWAALRQALASRPSARGDPQGDGQGDCGSAVMALGGLFSLRAMMLLAPMSAQPSITSPNC